MKTLSTEEAVEAYRTMGLRPMKNGFRDGEKCCALVAIVAARHGLERVREIFLYGGDPFYELADALAVTYDEVVRFAHEWDGLEGFECRSIKAAIKGEKTRVEKTP